MEDLVAMGFSRDQVEVVWRSAGGNFDRALDQLLNPHTQVLDYQSTNP